MMDYSLNILNLHLGKNELYPNSRKNVLKLVKLQIVVLKCFVIGKIQYMFVFLDKLRAYNNALLKNEE